jgi:hypothetical protein
MITFYLIKQNNGPTLSSNLVWRKFEATSEVHKFFYV